MDSFEFLGGRYNRPEQIMSGPVQAFRAQNAADGRTVFIHRVSTISAAEEQAALLKQLTTALVKSSEAKRLVLDFGDERGYWYVVTESEPQCALLREWLQMEIDSSLASQSPALPQAHPGEFARIIQKKASSAVASTGMGSQPVPVTPATAVVPGEFSNFFQKPLQTSADANAPSLNTPTSNPGEFARFFRASQPERIDKPLAPPVAPQPVAPQTPAVIPTAVVLTPTATQPIPIESGESTSLPLLSPQPPTVAGEAIGITSETTTQPNLISDDLIDDRIEISIPTTSLGEVPRVIDAVSLEAPLLRAERIGSLPRHKSLLDEVVAGENEVRTAQKLQTQRPQDLAAGESEAPPTPPAEYAMIRRRNGRSSATSNPKLPKVNAAPVAPSVIPPAPIDLPVPNFGMPVKRKSGGKKKLVIFLILLAILAALLAAGVVFFMKNK